MSKYTPRKFNPYSYGRGNKQFVDGEWSFLNLKIDNSMRDVLIREAGRRTNQEGIPVSVAVIVREAINSYLKDELNKIWTAGEEEYLRLNYKNNPTDLSKTMGKTPASIRSKARRMGL